MILSWSEVLAMRLEPLPLIWMAAVSLIAAACAPTPARAQTRRSRYIEFSEPDVWGVEVQGDYHARYDRRDLYCAYHLSTTAAAGDHATLTAAVTIPEEWQPPYGIEFYCSDDYRYDSANFENPGWMSVHAYSGRRFKQVLVDGEVVWEADVGDVVREERLGIDLTDVVTPGKPFELALRVIDKVATDDAQDGDFFAAGGFDPEEDPKAFMTHVYWGDVLTTEGFDASALHAGRESPSAQLLRQRIAAGEVPTGPAKTAELPVTLTVEAPRGAAAGYPMSCGVPLPEGAVTDVARLALSDAAGNGLDAQFSPLSSWPDGSVRSARVSMALPEGVDPGDRWNLTQRGRATDEDAAVRAQATGDGLIVSNELIALRIGDEGLLRVTSAAGGSVAGALRAYAIVEDDGASTRYDARWDAREVVDEGPRQVTAELRGTLIGPTDELGRCVLRFSVTADSPVVRTWLRVYNDTDRHLSISDLAITQKVQSTGTRGVAATLDAPEGWRAVDGEDGTVFAAVRWAAEMPTKLLEVDGDELTIHLFKATDEIPHFRPRSGEAKRHELLLGYFAEPPTDETLAALAGSCQRPPRLWDTAYACATGALGYAYPRLGDEHAALSENRTTAYGDFTRDRTQMDEYDIRNFGDRRYGDTGWCNNYYDASRGFLAEYMMTGNTNAFDRAEEQVLHQIDIDTCHWNADPSLVGGLWTYQGDDHSNGGYCWTPLRRALAGMVYYYRLTGDPDARETARDLAEYVLRDNHHLGWGSVRDHGGTLTALVWAYDEFGDERYLTGALDTMADIHTRMVRRRGPYVEPNGNYSWWLAIPWMASEMADAHHRLFQVSGNEEAAVTALGLIESMMMENGTWGLPGEMGGYSGNPYLGGLRSHYHIIIAPVMGLGYEMTGDPEFLLWARACLERTLAESSVDAITNNYWLAPSLLYTLNRHEQVETRMPPAPEDYVPPNVPRE